MSTLREKYGLNETAVINLKDGADEPMIGADNERCTVTVYAPGTKQHNRARARETNESVDRFQKKGKSKINAEEFEKDRVEYAVTVTKSVSKNLADDLAPGLEGRDQLLKIFTDPDVGFLILEQVHTEQRKTENFTKASTGA